MHLYRKSSIKPPPSGGGGASLFHTYNPNPDPNPEGLKERGSLLTFFPWKRGGGLIREGELNRGFTVCSFKITRHLFYMILFFLLRIRLDSKTDLSGKCNKILLC